MRFRQMVSLQVLRGIAAIIVVCHHVFRTLTINLATEFPDLNLAVPSVLQHGNLIDLGSAGVDIFFVLSGFLMIYISEPYRTGQRTVGHFLMQRIIRIWPLYVLATLAALLPSILDFARSGALTSDLTGIRLAGLLFVPSFDAHGALQPILGVGWTLDYEALFYLCFAAVLLTVRDHLLLGLSGLLAGLYLVGSLLPVGTVPGAFLSNSILFEFLYGAAIASFLVRGATIDRKVGAVALAAGLVGLFAFSSVLGDSPYRLFTRGIPAALILIGAVSLEASVTWPAILVRLGNASYSIYLVHVLVIYRLVRRVLVPAVHFGLGAAAFELAAAIAIAGAILVGVLVHYCVEVPLLALCRSGYDWVRRRLPRPAIEEA